MILIIVISLVDEEVVVENERRNGHDPVGDEVVKTGHGVVTLCYPSQPLDRPHLKSTCRLIPLNIIVEKFNILGGFEFYERWWYNN